MSHNPQPWTPEWAAEARKMWGKPAPHRVLVVDDDDWNLRYVTGVLKLAGYEVVQARTGVEGLDVYREDKNGFSLVLSDWSMPYMMGTDMLRQIRQIQPKQRMMMMSSDPERVRGILEVNQMSDIRVLNKCFDPHELGEAVAEGLTVGV